MIGIDEAALDKTLQALKERLLRARNSYGFWEGRLSGSALSTAVAAFALALAGKRKYASLINKAIAWLIHNQNSDGGWGDTIRSISNISTTMLCWSSMTVAEPSNRSNEAVAKAESWLAHFAGSLDAEALADAVTQQYGRDRSFSAPILTMCALAGRLGDPAQAWKRVASLPFELAMLPHCLYSWLRLPVVSYALPALIAIGQVHYHHRRPANPLIRLLRRLSLGRTLKVLQSIQPENGGFLEAAPLTAFVVMSLAASGQRDSEVVRKGVEFLVNSIREDGSWPIDTNLATWVTTLLVNALAAGGNLEQTLPPDERDKIRQMLLGSQYHRAHPYTHAAPGGWAWTALPGAVPDADDTAGALIALKSLGTSDENTTKRLSQTSKCHSERSEESCIFRSQPLRFAQGDKFEIVSKAAAAGIEWLLGIQNSDGGIPTFCRGWTNLPFDRSTPDLTAHALAAFTVWSDSAPQALQRRIDRAVERGLDYLKQAQRPNGAWVPLWFGNQYAPNQENPVYGTARVLLGLLRLSRHLASAHTEMPTRAGEWLLSVQNPDGGWGGDKAVTSSIEETALAVDALAEYTHCLGDAASATARLAVSQGAAWLLKQAQTDAAMTASPIGLYFAKLWYSEALYPLIFTVSALQKAKNIFLHHYKPRP